MTGNGKCMNSRGTEMKQIEAGGKGRSADGKRGQLEEPIADPDAIAEALDELERYLEPESPNVIRHPLVTFVGYNRNQPDVCEMIVEQYWQKRDAIDDALFNEEWVNVVMLHEPCFRFDALREYQGMMDDADYWRCVRYAWTVDGCITDNHTLVREIFAPENRTAVNRWVMMTEDERAVYDALPDRVEVYRGCGSASRTGWSWTTRRDKGEWFARRFVGVRRDQFGGLLLTGRCDKRDIIAYLDGRYEAEIVIDPDHVEISESVAIDEDEATRPSWGQARPAMTDPGRLTAAKIRQFEPKPDWFVRTPEGIHGLGHETRVLIWSQVLVSMVGHEDLDVDGDVVGWAAAVHDTQRWNNGIDGGHGARAADWILERPHLIPASVPIEQVAYVCRWHVPNDDNAPEMTPELKVFKDADALDRWRIDDLDPAFLRTTAARQLLDSSYSLWEATRGFVHATAMFEQIIEIARKQGLVVDA